jgi:hypothetical protein
MEGMVMSKLQSIAIPTYVLESMWNRAASENGTPKHIVFARMIEEKLHGLTPDYAVAGYVWENELKELQAGKRVKIPLWGNPDDEQGETILYVHYWTGAMIKAVHDDGERLHAKLTQGKEAV